MFRWRKILVIVVISTALFFLDKAGVFDYGVNLIRNFIIQPATRTVIYLAEESLFISKNIFGIRGVIKENIFLKNELDFFRGEYFRLANVSQENEFLRQALDLEKEKDGRKIVLADILSFDPFQANDSFIINKGRRDGVKENDPVILQGNVAVGRVKEVGEKDSHVLLLTSPQSKITVVSENDAAKGVVLGSASGALTLDLVLKDAELHVGEIFLASGLDGVFKRGYLIGELTKITSGDSAPFQQASMKPFFSLRDLKQVFVVVSE